MCIRDSAYTGGDPISFFEKHNERITYIHLKNLNLRILNQIRNKNSSMIEGISKGVFCEPDKGIINLETFAHIVRKTNYSGIITVEQDMYQPDHDKPLMIAKRTRKYLKNIGLG